MTEPTMRERIARAICRAAHARFSDEYTTPAELDGIVDHYWKSHADQSDAVLAELEMPTKTIVEAGMDATDWPICSGEVEHRWQAMIAEAKKP